MAETINQPLWTSGLHKTCFFHEAGSACNYTNHPRQSLRAVPSPIRGQGNDDITEHQWSGSKATMKLVWVDVLLTITSWWHHHYDNDGVGTLLNTKRSKTKDQKLMRQASTAGKSLIHLPEISNGEASSNYGTTLVVQSWISIVTNWCW